MSKYRYKSGEIEAESKLLRNTPVILNANQISFEKFMSGVANRLQEYLNPKKQVKNHPWVWTDFVQFGLGFVDGSMGAFPD